MWIHRPPSPASLSSNRFEDKEENRYPDNAIQVSIVSSSEDRKQTLLACSSRLFVTRTCPFSLIRSALFSYGAAF